MRESRRDVEALTAVIVTTVGLQGQGEALVLPAPSENQTPGGHRTGHLTVGAVSGTCSLWDMQSWGH